MSVVNLSQIFLFTTCVAFGLSGHAQSRYCMALALEAEELEAEWLTENSRRLNRDEAILAAEYVFAPIIYIRATPTPPSANEMCRRANSNLSKKAASLCYCRGSQSYSYQLFEIGDEGCEIYASNDTGNLHAYTAARIQCY